MGFSFGGVPAIFSEPGASPAFLDRLRPADGMSWVVAIDPGVHRLGLADPLIQNLSRQGSVCIFDDIRPEPKVENVDALAERLRSTRATGLVAVGGGSVMDVAKLAPIVASLGVSTEACLLGRRPLVLNNFTRVLIPTTAGTGSEVTRTGVYSLNGTKVWAWGEGMLPDLVVHDPCLTVGLPGPMTVATGVDALIHAIEAWAGHRPSPLIELFAARALEGVVEHLPRVLQHPDDLEARAGMLMAASYAGVAIDNGGTGVAHAVGHALGSMGNIHHGKSVALAMGATLPWNVSQAPEKFTPVANHLGCSVGGLGDWFQGFVHDAGMDRQLGFGWDGTQFRSRLFSPENQPMLENNACALDPTHAGTMQRLMEQWIQ